MRVDCRVLLSALLDGQIVFTNSEPSEGEIQRLRNAYTRFVSRFPKAEIPEGTSKRQQKKIQSKAITDEIYRRYPKLKRVKGEIRKTGKCLKIIEKHGIMRNSGEYADFCKDMIRKMDVALNGKHTLRMPELYDYFEYSDLERQWSR